MYKLTPNIDYTDSGNIFSRVFLIKENLGNKNLIIFDSEDERKKFFKIWRHFYKDEVYFIEDEKDELGLFTKKTGIYIATSEKVFKSSFSEYEIGKNTIDIKRGRTYNPDDFIKKIIDFGYKYSNHLTNKGSYNKDGDIINIFDNFENKIYKLSFFGDEVDEILVMDNLISKNIEKLNNVSFPNLTFIGQSTQIDNVDMLDNLNKYLKNTHIFLIGCDLWEKKDTFKLLNTYHLSDIRNTSLTSLFIEKISIENLNEFEEYLKRQNYIIKIYTKNSRTIRNFIEYNNLSSNIEIIEIPPSLKVLESFSYKKGSKIIANICDDILSDIFVEKRIKKSLAKNLDLMLEIKIGDYVVHIDHGIGIFKSIAKKDLSGILREYIELEYRENDKLYVPISELHRISKYIGNENPKLTRLNSSEWQKIMKSTEVEIERIANELLEIYAKRNMSKGYEFYSFNKEQEEFKNRFKYKHTLDQSSSIKEIFTDMESPKPMDRLIVGDVGFGKTEIAMNAIYKCILNKKQVAFISPLVILAYEHYESLKNRFEEFGIKIGIMTRVSTKKEAQDTLKKLSTGEIDCVIGTHRLLSEDIAFKNLGLVIIDEEHKFGVIDKEKLNKLKSNYDILSLSATPIPRSLNFALNGIKDISIINTPPPSKKPIDTFVMLWNDSIIVEAILTEFKRGGQVIFIHNRVATIDATKRYLEKIIGKDAKIIITHGQMSGLEVEDRILDFKNQKYNILLSTTVIENGVNFHNANTIILDDADTFGLSQLHQLRGRVGRGDIKGYAFLVYRKENLQDDAKKRLITIVNNTHLGAGFEIALRDLEIRGAGDILGIKQSGKSSETGISLYIKLLEEKIEELKTGKKVNTISCKIELNISYFINDEFFSGEKDKIHFFKNIESIETIEDLNFAYETFIKSNDIIDEELENLFLILKTRIILSQYGVTCLKKVGQSYIFEIDSETDIEKIRGFLDRFDKNGDFILITVYKIKAETRFWHGDKDFLTKLIKA